MKIIEKCSLWWPKISESDLPVFNGSSGNQVEMKTDGQTIKLFGDVKSLVDRDRVKCLEVSQIILGFWSPQMVPLYQDREMGSNISRLGKNTLRLPIKIILL